MLIKLLQTTSLTDSINKAQSERGQMNKLKFKCSECFAGKNCNGRLKVCNAELTDNVHNSICLIRLSPFMQVH